MSTWNDLAFTADGDFLVDGSGDLADLDRAATVEDSLRDAVRQTIVHRTLAETNGWRNAPCAGLERFQGRSVDADTIAAIESAIALALVVDGAFRVSDVVVKVLPIAGDTVAVIVAVPSLGNLPVATFGVDVSAGMVSQVK